MRSNEENISQWAEGLDRLTYVRKVMNNSPRIVQKRSFFYVIPSSLLLNKDLSGNEKILLMTIISVDEDNKRFGQENYPTNAELMENAEVSDKTFRKAIRHLKELGYIDDTRKKGWYELNYNKLEGVLDCVWEMDNLEWR